jgi:hypothetical protein
MICAGAATFQGALNVCAKQEWWATLRPTARVVVDLVTVSPTPTVLSRPLALITLAVLLVKLALFAARALNVYQLPITVLYVDAQLKLEEILPLNVASLNVKHLMIA